MHSTCSTPLADARDPLTGAWSKSHWPRVVAGAARGAPVALIDLDHMKHFNMHNGHDRGDAILASLGAYLIADTTGAAREVVRLGGQTFGLVWTDADATASRARETCEAFRRWARNSLGVSQPARCGDANCLGPASLTLTIALTCVQENDDDAAILARLDVAIVQAKRAGRDRVVMSFAE